MAKKRAVQLGLDGTPTKINKPKPPAESEIQRALLDLQAKLKDVCLFRNNVGTAKTYDGRFIRFGLCEGSSDLIGFVKRKITPEMIGQEVAIFCAVEVKTSKGKVSEHQQHFIDMVNNQGGIAGIVRSIDDSLKLLR